MCDRPTKDLNKSNIKNRINKIKTMSVGSIVRAVLNNISFRFSLINHKIRDNRWEYYRKKESNKLQKTLQNDNFTILCQNCTGGYMYNLLGKRFDSPTINLYIIQPDFSKFCADLEYYLNQELRFYRNPEDLSCPYAHLGTGEKEIWIAFTHYKSEDEARKKWEERKKRIHWDNLYIVTNDGNEVTPEELRLLNDVTCKRKIVFTTRERPEIDDYFVLHTLKDRSAVHLQVKRHWWTGYRSWEIEFDLSAWLNGEDGFRKKY